MFEQMVDNLRRRSEVSHGMPFSRMQAQGVRDWWRGGRLAQAARLSPGALLRPGPRQRVEVIQFLLSQSARETGPIKCSLIVAREQAILFCHCHQAICPLDTVGVHLDAAIVQETLERIYAIEGRIRGQSAEQRRTAASGNQTARGKPEGLAGRPARRRVAKEPPRHQPANRKRCYQCLAARRCAGWR
jgi:hypothetical protein